VELNYDKTANALEILFEGGGIVARTIQFDAGTLVDIDEQGAIVTIEVIRPARRWPLEEILADFTVDDTEAEILRALWRQLGTLPFAEQSEVGAAATTGDEFVLA
jgi:uncharacterized protein YuzE